MTTYPKVTAAEQDARIGGKHNRPRCPGCGEIVSHCTDAGRTYGFTYRCQRRGCAMRGKSLSGPGYPSGERHYQYGLRRAETANWKGQDIGYEGAHARKVREAGNANGHACADCGDDSGQGHEWSYVYACPNERVQIGGVANGCPYCACDDAQHYVPRCVPCHRKHDASVTRLADTA